MIAIKGNEHHAWYHQTSTKTSCRLIETIGCKKYKHRSTNQNQKPRLQAKQNRILNQHTHILFRWVSAGHWKPIRDDSGRPIREDFSIRGFGNSRPKVDSGAPNRFVDSGTRKESRQGPRKGVLHIFTTISAILSLVCSALQNLVRSFVQTRPRSVFLTLGYIKYHRG